jgi:DNA-binding beta-propeller fold protein YncE
MKKILIIACLAVVFNPLNLLAFSTPGFQKPYGVAIDEATGFIYVSNMVDGFDMKNADGFISRLAKDGSVDQMRLFGGQQSGKTLNSPKGMEVFDGRLYIADVDQVRVFELKDGKFLYNLNFGTLPIRHVVDILKGPDNCLYVTDAGSNTIFRIDVARQHEVTIFAEGDFLNGPHGICWNDPKQAFVVASWGSGQLIEFDKAGKRTMLPSVTLQGLDACASDSYGNMYLSSSPMSAVYRVSGSFALFGFALGQQSPAGLVYNPAAKELIVVSTDQGKVESFPVDTSGK